uniref:Uncharacterized protein n=1 Tax=Nelumbo nucifera TaxID=4432 RepID=A0A822Z2I7_NELNU|nr:TPA_asm: hypothetical protein HUJ06_008552 [Nelumbo nucifera]
MILHHQPSHLTWEGMRSPLVGMLERGLLVQHIG